MFQKLFAVCLLVSAFSQPVLAAKDDSLDKVLKSKKITIGCDLTYPPMEFEDKKGKPDGFGVQLGKEIAKRLGVEAEHKPMNWDGILAGLIGKRYDILMSSMTVTPERSQQVNFIPYFEAQQVFVTKKNAKPVKTDKDLTDKIVTVQADTTSYYYVEKLQKAGLKLKKLSPFRMGTEAMATLQSGQSEVAVIDEPVGTYYVKETQKLKPEEQLVISGVVPGTEVFGIALNKEDEALKTKITQVLSEIKADGTYDKLANAWFGKAIGKK